MYIEEHTHPVPGGISIIGLTRQDLVDFYRALAYTLNPPKIVIYRFNTTSIKDIPDRLGDRI